MIKNILLALRGSKVNELRRIRIKKNLSTKHEFLIQSRVTMFGRRSINDIKLIIDVGANDGFSFLYGFVKNNLRIKFIAFEPVPSLFNAIKIASHGLPNYKVEQYAIDIKEDSIRMGVSNVIEGGGGVSSLLAFKDNAINERSDFYFEKFIEVKTITLEHYLNDNAIEKIDYLHIDAQGKDLDVLRSLGGSINKVIAGVIECAQGLNGILYKGQPIGNEIENYLVENGFDIVLREYQESEYNAYFIQKKYNNLKI